MIDENVALDWRITGNVYFRLGQFVYFGGVGANPRGNVCVSAKKMNVRNPWIHGFFASVYAFIETLLISQQYYNLFEILKLCI